MKPRPTLRATVILLAAAYPAYLQPQQGPLNTSPSPIWTASNGGRSLDAADNTPITPPAVREKMEHVRQSERQRRMIADTDRLLALANELKSTMDKAPKETPSADVIRKTEEIEKLARSVKDRMKG